MKTVYLFSFTFYPEQNGVSNVVLDQAVFLNQMGYDVHVITSFSKKRTRSDELIKDLTVHEFNIRGGPKIYNFYRGEIFRYVKFINRSTCEAAIIHCWQVWSTDLFLFANRIDYKTIFVSHCAGVNTNLTLLDKVNKILLFPYRLVMASLMKKFDNFVFLSRKKDNDRFMDSTMLEELGFEHKKHIIPNRVRNYSNFCRDPKLQKHYTIENLNYIICVANYQKVKNQELAIRVFEELTFDCKLVLIGSSKSKYYHKLMHLRNSSRKKNCILLLDDVPREEILNLIYYSKIMINTSKTECMPLSVLESIGMSKPVVSTDVGNVSDIGGVELANDVHDFSRIIYRLFHDYQYYQHLVNDAIAYCDGNLGESNIHQYIDLIEKGE